MLGMREETVVVEGVVAMVVALQAIDRQAVAGRSCLSIVATILMVVAVYMSDLYRVALSTPNDSLHWSLSLLCR